MHDLQTARHNVTDSDLALRAGLCDNLRPMMSQWWNRLFCACVLVSSLPSWAAAAGETAASSWIDSAKTDLHVFPDRLKSDAKATFFNNDNLAALAWAGLASVAMNNGNADDDVADHFARHQTFDNFGGDALKVVGSPGFHFPAAMLWYAISAHKQDEPNKLRALTMLSALTINGVVTTALKAARHNDQPDGEMWAWPSGHTSSSFTVASVLHEFYGPKVGIPAYFGAGVVAWRMMDQGDHWASDVVFGATLGWVVGHTVAGNHRGPEIAGFDVLPYYGSREEPAVGIHLLRCF
jgi:hypothetical protein